MITNRDTGETLLCVAYVFEVSTSEHGAQHHIYRLVKDWALRRRQRSRDHHAKWRGVRAHVNFCRADSFNDTNDEQLTTKCVDESNRTKNA